MPEHGVPLTGRVIMTTDEVPRPKFRARQRVQVLVVDVEIPGHPEVWRGGTVNTVVWQATVRTFAVNISVDGGGSLNLPVTRGGNKYIRPLRSPRRTGQSDRVNSDKEQLEGLNSDKSQVMVLS